MKTELRPTTPEDVEAFLGCHLPYRARAYTGLVDDEIKGIGGIAMLPDGTSLAFLHLAEGAERYRVMLHKAARLVIENARKRGVKQIVAQADTARPAAERWLARLGFEPVPIDGERVWLWQN